MESTPVVRIPSPHSAWYTMHPIQTFLLKIQGFSKQNLYICIAQKPVEQFLVINKGTEMVRIPANRLVFISADGNYSVLVTQDNREWVVSYQLGQMEDIIVNQLGEEGSSFVRLGRSLIVNTCFVTLIDITKQRIVLSDCFACYHDLTASREVLVQLKAYLEARR